MAKNTVTVTDNRNGKSVDLPILEPVYGKDVVDIAGLPKELDMFTFDPGYAATGSCESAITFIDGDKGELLYRGYSIEDLAEKKTYLEVVYLLLYGDLPSEEEAEKFKGIIMTHTLLNENMKDFLRGFNYDAHPMAMLAGTVASMAGFYHDKMDIYNPEHREITAHRLISKLPTLAAYCYKHGKGQPYRYPQNHLSYTGNFLHMMFSTPCEAYEVDPIAAKAIDTLFILHADHEQNASTSTVRLSGSAGTNPFAAIAAGITTLWGPAHGGANEAVLRMLEEIGTVDNIPKYIAKAKDRDDPFRLMGFGHRVYKNFDPRAKIIKRHADDILNKYGNDPLMEIAKKLEEIALQDEFFIERKLYPNVDFYSGIIYKALGIPVEMFTPMFTIARTSGWISHWMEMIEDPMTRIGRPRQRYVGPKRRDI